VKHKPYSVPCPNALWHMDGHHKMIHWGVVIHGIIDGFDRTMSAFHWFSCYLWAHILDIPCRWLVSKQAPTIEH
ncbi:hypothetical protein C8J56DRAFT_795449, partial [Mycena floridula]